MTIRLRFSKTDMVATAGMALRPLEVDDKGVLFERLGQAGITERFDHEALAALLRQPETRYYAGYFEREFQNLTNRKPARVLNDLPDEIRRLTIWRVAFAKAFLGLEATGKVYRTHASYVAALPQLNAETCRLVGEAAGQAAPGRPGTEMLTRRLPGSRTAFQWIRDHERAGYSPLSLAPEIHRSGNRRSRWCPKTEVLMGEVIHFYADTQRPTKIQAINATRGAFALENSRRSAASLPLLTVPSKQSIRRRLNQADPYYLHAKRYGAAAANAKFTLYMAGLDVQHPLERVEMDECKLDVITLLTLAGAWDHLPQDRRAVLETGRRWLYVAIDCATKCILSMRLAETPNAEDAVRALRDVFSDKTPIAIAAGCETTWHHHGGIGTLVTDQGSAFVSDHFQGAAQSLGITTHLPPAGLPWLRGHIESLFRTFGHKLMPLLLGRTFFDSVERGDYPSEQLACLCDDDLIRILLTFVVDVYHNEPHGSLKGETPNAAWARLVGEYGTPPVPDGLALRQSFGRPLQRTLRGDGVLFAGLSYSCDALREAFLHSTDRKVDIRVDLCDLGWIAVKVGAFWHSAIANQSGFDGVGYEELVEANRSLRLRHQKQAEFDAPTVRRAIDRITEINRQALMRQSLTPFHVTDGDIERNQAALHFAIRPDAERFATSSSTDPLMDGIQITPKPQLSPPRDLPETRPPGGDTQPRTNRWGFSDES